MAAQTSYAEIKRWAERTGRRSVQMWLREDALRRLDRLCGELDVGRAELIEVLVRDVDARARTVRSSADQVAS
jgi:hypothetical protein